MNTPTLAPDGSHRAARQCMPFWQFSKNPTLAKSL